MHWSQVPIIILRLHARSSLRHPAGTSEVLTYTRKLLSVRLTTRVPHGSHRP